MNPVLGRFASHGLAVLLAACPPVVLAAAHTEMTSQQRMSACSKENKGKKGDDYKQGVADCMSGKTSAAAEPMTSQQRMSMCSKQSKGKKGDDYKKSVADCMKAA